MDISYGTYPKLDKKVDSNIRNVRIAVADQGYGLDKLIYDEDYGVRIAVAYQGYGLDILVRDKDEDVRKAVAKQGYGLDKLINDKNSNVRGAVVRQDYGLDKLVYDKDKYVRRVVQNYLEENCYNSLFEWANVNPDKVVTNLDINKWLNSANKYKRIEVAKHGYSLDKLIHDEDAQVREKTIQYLKDNGYKSISDWVEANSDKINNPDKMASNKVCEDSIKDFIYKIDNSSKLKIESTYDSIDDFFNEDSDNSDGYLAILTVDTKIPLIRLEKTDSKNRYKFIVDINAENDDTYVIETIFKTKEKLVQLINSTIETLNAHPQFSKYADDLENCL